MKYDVIVFCPCCNNEDSVSVEDSEGEDRSMEIKCTNCDRRIEFSYNTSHSEEWEEIDSDLNFIEIEAFDVSLSLEDIPPIEFKCPACGCQLSRNYTDECGEEEEVCDCCGKDFYVCWDSYGYDQSVRVGLYT